MLVKWSTVTCCHLASSYFILYSCFKDLNCHGYTHVYLWYTHVYLYVYVYMYVYAYVYAYASVRAHINVHAHVQCKYICMYACVYVFDVVNFDALAQASDFRIERRQVVFLCWMQDSNPEGLRNRFSSRLNVRWLTDWAIEDQANKLELDSPSLCSAQRAFSPLHPTAVWNSHLALAIYMCVVVNFDALAQASHFRIERRQVVFLGWMQIRTQRVSETESPADWMPADKATELSRTKPINLNSTARPNDQRAFSPLDPTVVWHSHLALAMFNVYIYSTLMVILPMPCWGCRVKPHGMAVPSDAFTHIIPFLFIFSIWL